MGLSRDFLNLKIGHFTQITQGEVTNENNWVIIDDKEIVFGSPEATTKQADSYESQNII